MAESYTISDDGLVWTFKLRDSKWSDGQPVTANDFVYSWRRLVDPDTAAPYSLDMGGFIKNGEAITEGTVPVDQLGVKALDDKTLEVTLENPCPYFEQISAFATFSPIRQDIVEKYGSDNWTKTAESYVSNGPFKCLEYVPDGQLAIVPNPGYWDAASVVPKQINFKFLADDKAAYAAFRAGELDYLDVPPQEEVDSLKADGFYGDTAELGTYYISYNTQKAPLDNVNVRKALTLAVDTDFIANTLRQGAVKPAEAFVGDGFTTSGYDKAFRDGWQTYVSPKDYEANKAAAKQALADAGYPDGAGFPKLEYLYNDNSTHAAIGEALQNMWKEVLGIDVELKVADWNTVLQDRRNGNFDIARNGWIADYNDPATMLNLFMSNSGNNDGKYTSPDYDAKLNAANAEQDPAKRNQLLHEAEDILLGQDWALAPIYYYTITWAVNPNLKDWGVTPLGYKFFQKAHK
jgi:oligopeptide transport system substrate-binding protein